MSAIELVPAAPATNPTREIDFPAGIAAFPLARSHDRTDSSTANPIERTAELSTCGRFRYRLARRWAPGPLGLVVMVNPSTADAEVDDPTIRRLIGWHQRWGMAGFSVVNLLPIRTPKPRAAFDWFCTASIDAGADQQALHKNLDAIEAEATQARQVMVAWGCLHPDLQQLAAMTLETLQHKAGDVHCLGLTQAGFPIHPMARGKHRVPDDITPQLFDASAHP